MSQTSPRVIWVNAHPHRLTTRLAQQTEWSVVTGSRLAAKAIAAQPTQTLRQLAIAHHHHHHPTIHLASGLAALRCLREILPATLNPTDPFGTARVWLPAVRDLLQSRAHLADCPPTGTPRLDQLLPQLLLTVNAIAAGLGATG